MSIDTRLIETEKSKLAFLTGPDGAEPRDGLSSLEIADAIVNAAQSAARTRLAQRSLRGASELSSDEKANLAGLLGRETTPHERVLLVRTLRVLLPQ